MSTELIPKDKFATLKSGKYFIPTYVLIEISQLDLMDANQKVHTLVDDHPEFEFMVASEFNGITIYWRPRKTNQATQGENN